jgi:hypothetical protein
LVESLLKSHSELQVCVSPLSRALDVFRPPRVVAEWSALWSRLMATGAGSRFGNEKGDLLVALAGTSLSG